MVFKWLLGDKGQTLAILSVDEVLRNLYKMAVAQSLERSID